ncbi:MAG: hypothetical protein QNJ22_14045 [Desulfosarcinaceae bacterium]|nr:hypothetical protein [Desulfosarcinaceae bacterium]
MTNPYNCTKPGNLFVGYARLIQEIINGLRNGHSYALIGGRRCGKTSLLMQLEKILNSGGLESYAAQVHRFSIQRFDTLSVAGLFGFIYATVTAGCDVPAWPERTPRGVYQTFLDLLETHQATLVDAKGARWLAILLVDELDAAIKRLPDDVFFQNLRHLLMDSPFHPHFRVVASGATEMAGLIYSGSSPLNNLRHKYLRILSAKQARKLLTAGFAETYETEVLFKLTGRHPYLLQGLLEKLWDQRPDCWDKATVRQAGKDFLREHRDFTHWLEDFDPAACAVYRQLAQAPGHALSFTQLREQVPPEVRTEVEDAITVLSYHGVIDDTDPDEPELAGTLFKNWFLNRTEPATCELAPTGATASTGNSGGHPEIHVQVNPVIHGATIEQTFSAEQVTQMQETIASLKRTIEELPIEKSAKLRAQHALDEADIELQAPATSGQPQTGTIKSAIEHSADILKSAGTATDHLNTFIQKANRIGPVLGQSMGWLSSLF